MNIGIDLRSLGESSIHRGIGTYVYNLLWSLAKVDLNNTYYLFAFNDQADYCLKNLPHTANFNYVFIKPSELRKKKFIRTLALGNPTLRIKHVQLNVIYQLDPFFPIKHKNIPVITIVYDLIPQLFKEQYIVRVQHVKNYVGTIIYIKDSLKHLLMKKALHNHKNSNAVIAISESTKNDLAKIIGVKKKIIKPILLGADKLIDGENKNKIDSKSFVKNINKPFILYVGGSDPRKGLLELIDDFSKVSRTNDIKLIIGGKEITDPRVHASKVIKRKINKLKISNKVILPGFVSDDELHYLYSNALAFVFPSRYEGFGLPILEAMQAGCPVICYDNSSLPEVAGSAALMVADGESMVPAIEKLITNPNLREELKAAGFKQAKKFTWEKTAKETLRLLEEVAKKK